MRGRKREPIIDLFKNYDLFDIGEFDDNANKLNELFEAYSIKQKCCDIIADKINEIKNCIANVGYLPISDKMKYISENVCNKNPKHYSITIYYDNRNYYN